jgi:hypothetical protein
MRHQSSGRELVTALGAGACVGAIFCFGFWRLDIGGLATLLGQDHDAITIATMVASLLGLFAISAFATLPAGERDDTGHRVRRSRRAQALAVRRPPRA